MREALRAAGAAAEQAKEECWESKNAMKVRAVRHCDTRTRAHGWRAGAEGCGGGSAVLGSRGCIRQQLRQRERVDAGAAAGGADGAHGAVGAHRGHAGAQGARDLVSRACVARPRLRDAAATLCQMNVDQAVAKPEHAQEMQAVRDMLKQATDRVLVRHAAGAPCTLARLTRRARAGAVRPRTGCGQADRANGAAGAEQPHAGILRVHQHAAAGGGGGGGDRPALAHGAHGG